VLSPYLPGVRAVTYSTQANTFMLLDDRDQPLTPFVVWNDTRAAALDAELAEYARDASFTDSTGLPTLNCQFTIAKLKLLMTPQARRITWLPDYFGHWLTGVRAGEGSVATITAMFDVPHWKWSDRACRYAGVDAAMLPPVVRAGDVVGEVRVKELGLPAGCLLIAGCLDQYAGALGVGNDRPGLLSETTGTVLAVVACSDRWESSRPKQVFRGPGSGPEQFFHMSFGEVSANLLEHYRNQLPDAPSFEALLPSETDRLELDPAAPLDQLKATITRWAADQPRGDVVRAIYRVVARALATHVSTLTTVRPKSICSAGGAARSWPWLQMKADVLGVPVIAPATEEPALLGAASLAARALGWLSLAVIDQPSCEDRTVHPARR
jgi:xylulokinase